MDQVMSLNIKNDLKYYGIYSTADDMWNGSDVLCAARKRFFETGTKQKKRSSIKADSSVYNYSYTLESGAVLKYKKMKDGHQIERVAETIDGYCVELTDDRHRPVKRTFYDHAHNWVRTEYLSEVDRSVEMLLAPSDQEGRPAVICKSGSKTELLYPFTVTPDKEITQKLNIMTSEPKVYCVTNYGSFYFCTDEEAEKRLAALEKLLKEQTPVEDDDSDRSVDSLFVVDTDTSAFQSGTFDLRNSREIRLSDQPEENNEPETAVPENEVDEKPEQGSKPEESPEEAETETKPEEPAEEAETETKPEEPAEEAETETKPEEPAEEAETETKPEEPAEEAKTKIKPEEAKTEEAPDEKPKTESSEASKRPAAKRPGRKKSDKTIAETETKKSSRTAKTEKTKVTVSDADEAAEPVAEGIFGAEKVGVSALSERVCSFSHDCPYETVDKQIIESGGKQYYYFGDIIDNKRSGRGRTVMKNGETAYEGGYLDDRREGFGVYYYKSGKLCYAGEWKGNKRQGLGAAFSPTDSSVFVGCWEDDVSVGTGAHFDRDGKLIYAGMTEDGRRSGAGMTYSEEDGTYFVGKYKNGEFLETGTQFSSDGDLLYTGGYRNNLRCGEGTSYNDDGSIKYKGQWYNNEYNGEGTLYTDDGKRITGTFKAGKAHGKCTMTDADGKVIYVGSIIDGKYNGTGRLFKEGGAYAEGRFVDGEPTGVFNEYDTDGRLVYCGEWENCERCGRGTEYRSGEKLYEGDFRDSVYNGDGKLYKNGEAVYIGHFRNGRKEGFGAEYSKNELVYKGLWKNGLYNGSGILYSGGEARFVGMFADGKRSGRINEIENRRVIRRSLYSNDEMTYTCEYSPDGSLVYYGGMSGNMRSGMGCSFLENAEKQFEGIFRNNEPEKSMKVLLKDLPAIPVCEELANTEYELYRVTPEYIIEKPITVGGVSGIYTGKLRSGVPDGSGTILYSDHRYTGYFINGKPEGEGVVYLPDGGVCRGIFSSEPFEDCKTLILSDVTYYYKTIL